MTTSQSRQSLGISLHRRTIFRPSSFYICTSLVATVVSGIAQTVPEAPPALPPPVPEEIIELEKVTVGGETMKGSLSDLKNQRANADISLDYLSANQIAKFSPSDLSEVVLRMPGISVAGGQFAVVRGLSDRFLSTTIQGLKIPSPDPERQAVQLDLLPASTVEAVIVSKTFSGAQWAESSGGNMDILARAIPSENQFKFGVGFKLNENALDGGPDYKIRSSSGHYVNNTYEERFGYGTRARLDSGKLDSKWQYVPTHRENVPFGNKVSVEFARAIRVGDGELGVLVSAFNEASYKAKVGHKQERGVVKATPAKPATPAVPPRPGLPRGIPAQPAQPGVPGDFEKGYPSSEYIPYDYEELETETISSLTAGVGYRFSPEHEIKFVGLFVQSGIDQAQINTSTPVTSIDPVTGDTIVKGGHEKKPDEALLEGLEYFRERNLTVGQLSGGHKLPSVHDLAITWALQRSRTYQKEHPLIETAFFSPLNNLYKSYSLYGGADYPTSFKAFWADNQETQKAGRLDFELPLTFWTSEKTVFKAGAAFEKSERETSGEYVSASPSGVVTASSTEFLYSSVAVPTLRGIVLPPSGASREIKAYYASVNLPIIKRVKLVGGTRYEDFTLAPEGKGQWGGNLSSDLFYSLILKDVIGAAAIKNPEFVSKKWYPGAGLIIEPLKSVVVRLHYSKTTGRPSLREVSPFFNKSIETDNLVIGNPLLKPSDSTNYDVRIDWSPTRTDFISVSAFRKTIVDPIEKMLTTGTISSASDSTETWFNNPNEAKLDGQEFEFRHGLGLWAGWLSDFSLSGNFTKIDASVGETPQNLLLLKNSYLDPTAIPQTRRLFDQPEYIANLELSWARKSWGTSVTVAGYAISDVLLAVSKPDFFDLYERAYQRYDFIFNQQLTRNLKLKITVKNFTDPEHGLIYDREATTRLAERNTFKVGREFGASITAEF